jgi:hypothetical protein
MLFKGLSMDRVQPGADLVEAAAEEAAEKRRKKR